MSRLETHGFSSDNTYFTRINEPRKSLSMSDLEPGMYVQLHSYEESLGMVVAVNQEEVCVLWSVEPPSPRVFLKPDDFKPHKGMMTRYDPSLVRSDYYGSVKVSDIT